MQQCSRKKNGFVLQTGRKAWEDNTAVTSKGQVKCSWIVEGSASKVRSVVDETKTSAATRAAGKLVVGGFGCSVDVTMTRITARQRCTLANYTI